MGLINMRIGIAFLVVTLTDLSSFAESGSVCVAPESGTLKPSSPTGVYCESGKLALTIDKQPAILWPTKESVKIGDLAVAVRHSIVIMCDGKPQQSFTFRFSELRATALCLFLDGAYRTVQLWEVRRSPWCKCKDARDS